MRTLGGIDGSNGYSTDSAIDLVDLADLLLLPPVAHAYGHRPRATCNACSHSVDAHCPVLGVMHGILFPVAGSMTQSRQHAVAARPHCAAAALLIQIRASHCLLRLLSGRWCVNHLLALKQYLVDSWVSSGHLLELRNAVVVGGTVVGLQHLLLLVDELVRLLSHCAHGVVSEAAAHSWIVELSPL